MKRICSSMVVCAALFAACQPAPASLSDADRAAIGELRAAVTSASLSGNLDAEMALYADDAIQLPPNAPMLRGKSAIRTATEAQPHPSAYTLTPADTWGVGDFAYERGTYDLTFPMPGMPDYHEVGKYLVLLKKQTDGSWKMATTMWSPDAMPPQPSATGT